jgi:hypothetical protein
MLERIRNEHGTLEGTTFVDDDLNAMLARARGERTEPSANPQMGALQHRVLVTCRDEAHQRELLAAFSEEGIEARAVIV